MLCSLGNVPPLCNGNMDDLTSLEKLVAGSSRPVAFFPEGTSSNNVGRRDQSGKTLLSFSYQRGLLRFMQLPASKGTGMPANLVALK